MSWGCAEQEALHLAGLLEKNGETAELLRQRSPSRRASKRRYGPLPRRQRENQRGSEQMRAYRRSVGELERLVRQGGTLTAQCLTEAHGTPRNAEKFYLVAVLFVVFRS